MKAGSLSALLTVVTLGFFSLLMVSAASATELTFYRVVDTDNTVPGGQPGETFANLFELALVSEYCVAFLAEGDMLSDGIYLWNGSGLEVVVDLQTPVPGGLPGDVFTELDSFSLDFCDVAYSAVINGADTAVFLKSQGATAQRVIDITTSVPGEAGVTFDEVGSVWLHFGDLAFRAAHGTCLGSPQAVTGVYFLDGGTNGVSAVADSCTTAVPGGQVGEIFSDLSEVTPVLDAGSVTFTGSGTMGSAGVYTTLGGTLRAVADLATALPGGQPGEIFGDLSDVSPISGDQIVFAAGGTMATVGVFREAAGGLDLHYDLAETPPGWLPGEVFDFENHEDEAFFCWHSAGASIFYGLGDQGSAGIYRTSGGEVNKLVAVGDVVSNEGEAVSALYFVALAKGEQIVFVAELDGVRQAVFVAVEVLFQDGFESGDLSDW